jgi:hypothetical protein
MKPESCSSNVSDGVRHASDCADAKERVELLPSFATHEMSALRGREQRD